MLAKFLARLLRHQADRLDPPASQEGSLAVYRVPGGPVVVASPFWSILLAPEQATEFGDILRSAAGARPQAKTLTPSRN